MRQRAEKYARSMERRVESLEESVEKAKESLTNHASRLNNMEDVVEGHTEKLRNIEADMDRLLAAYAGEVSERRREDAYTSRKLIRHQWEFERSMACQRRGLVVAIALAVVALIVAVKAVGTEQVAETIKPTAAAAANMEMDLLDIEPADAVLEASGPWQYTANLWTGE